MKLVFQGAEAKLYKKKSVLIKQRTAKEYRNKDLDKKIRKERTRLEARLLSKAKSIGMAVPGLIETDREKAEIKMEFIEGPRIKEAISRKNFKCLCRQIGKAIAKMHSYGMIHGDLTTSNMILNREKIFFVDFGLGFQSKKQEDMAVDLLTFKKTFEATHYRLMPAAWKKITEAYSENNEEAEKVFAQLEKAEKRGRYH